MTSSFVAVEKKHTVQFKCEARLVGLAGGGLLVFFPTDN